MAQADKPLEQFCETVTVEYSPNPEVAEGQRWIADALAYETRAAVKKKATAEQKSQKLKQEAIDWFIRQLKKTPANEYGDEYNRRVCQMLDQAEATETIFSLDISRLKLAEELVKREISDTIGETEIYIYLLAEIKKRKELKLKSLLSKGLKLTNDPIKAVSFASLMFELEERKTEDGWQPGKLSATIARGLSGEEILLVSMLCCLNQYDLNGGYEIITDPNAYAENPKLDPVGLKLAELSAVKDFFEFYGIKTSLKIIVADTEYTYVGKLGPLTPAIQQKITEYLEKLKAFIKPKDQAAFILASTLEASPLYQTTREEILRQVTKWSDPKFRERYYPQFERNFEEWCESQSKRRIFPANQIRGKALEITRKIWAVCAAEGMALGQLGRNIIFISTESRADDSRYLVADGSTQIFPPIIYPMQSVKNWQSQNNC